MNILRLNPELIDLNKSIRAASKESPPLSGIIYNGCNKVFAYVAPGSSGSAKVSFDITVPSISSHTFDAFRDSVGDLLGPTRESKISEAAGIRTCPPAPPPAPSSRMAGYALHLFADLLFDGEVRYDDRRSFSDGNCKSSDCKGVLRAIRSLDVSLIKFSGTLVATSLSADSTSVAAYVPLTSVEFKDRLTIPFSGYSDNVRVSMDDKDPRFTVLESFWTELPNSASSSL